MKACCIHRLGVILECKQDPQGLAVRLTTAVLIVIVMSVSPIAVLTISAWHIGSMQVKPRAGSSEKSVDFSSILRSK